MVSGSWDGKAKTPPIKGTVNASLENVEREGQDFAEVTNLGGAVRAWIGLEPRHKLKAVLTIERPIQLDGVSTTRFTALRLQRSRSIFPAAFRCRFSLFHSNVRAVGMAVPSNG